MDREPASVAQELVAAHTSEAWQRARGTLLARRDPVAKHARRIDRAARRTAWRAGGTAGLVSVAVIASPVTTPGSVFVVLAGAGAWTTVTAGRRWWRLLHTPPPQPLPVPPPRRRGSSALPARRSAARAPMTRLRDAHRALDRLLPVLGPLAGDAAADASRAEVVLAQQAATLHSLERARATAPPAARAELDQAVRLVAGRLEDAVAAYESLVTAAAAAAAAQVGAGTVGAPSGQPLAVLAVHEAADRLVGLAEGLRATAMPRYGTPTG